MKSQNHPDYTLIIVVSILLVFGILLIANISAFLSLKNFNNSFYYLKHQLFFGLLPGLILGFVAYKININIIKKWASFLFLINLFFAAIVFLPQIGLTLGGATRWLKLGNIVLQPSEFLKLSVLIYLSYWLATRNDDKIFIEKQNKKRFILKNNSLIFNKTLFGFLTIIGLVSAILYFQSDASTLGIIALTAIIIYFLAQTPILHNILIILCGICGVFILILAAPYRWQRLSVFLHPNIDPLGIGYQLKQSLIAVGSGGIYGLGLGMSRQKFGFLPHPITDSIFAVFSEEMGFVGAVILISLFIVFLIKGFKIANKSENQFHFLLAAGITSWIVLQAFVNISSMIGIFPLSGIPLPFISYGGSHLIAELVGTGILLNISKNK